MAARTATGSQQIPMSDGKRGAFGMARRLEAGDVTYLWVLVFLEVGAILALRHAFRRSHGG